MQTHQKKYHLTKVKRSHDNVTDFIAACKKDMGSKIANSRLKCITIDQRFKSQSRIKEFTHQRKYTNSKETANSLKLRQRQNKIKSALMQKVGQNNYRLKTPGFQRSKPNISPVLKSVQIKSVKVNRCQVNKQKIIQFLKNIEGINSLKIRQSQLLSGREKDASCDERLIHVNKLDTEKYVHLGNLKGTKINEKYRSEYGENSVDQNRVKSSSIYERSNIQKHVDNGLRSPGIIKPSSAQSSSKKRTQIGARDCSKASILKESQQKNSVNQCINIQTNPRSIKDRRKLMNIKKNSQNVLQDSNKGNRIVSKRENKDEKKRQNCTFKQNEYKVDQNVQPWDFQASVDYPIIY